MQKAGQLFDFVCTYYTEGISALREMWAGRRITYIKELLQIGRHCCTAVRQYSNAFCSFDKVHIKYAIGVRDDS